MKKNNKYIKIEFIKKKLLRLIKFFNKIRCVKKLTMKIKNKRNICEKVITNMSMFKIWGKFISFKKVTTGIKNNKIEITIESLLWEIINYF